MLGPSRVTEIDMPGGAFEGEATRPAQSYWNESWERLRANRIGVAAGILILILALIALAAPLFSQFLTHFDPARQHLIDNFRSPGRPYLLGTDELGRDELTRLIYGGRVTLGVAFNLRQHPAYRRARELVAAGALGRIVLAQAQWAFGVRGRDGSPPRTPLTQWWDTPELIGGASTMMGTGVHSVDLLRFVLGAEVDEITAVTDGQTVARPLEQLACLTLRFDNGTLGQVVASRLLPDSRNDFRVYGITGLIASEEWLP